MAAREDGEFELILGNKQLLSVLFIVIVLLGVFFVMGFLAGRSTGSAAVAAKKTVDQTPIPVASARPEPAQPGEVAPDAASSQPAAELPKAEPAKAETTKPEPAKPAAKPEPAKPEPAKAEPKRPAASPSRSGGFVETPPSGTYLQAAATRRADAETMLALISSKTGLHGYVTPSPKSPELCRVILGPLKGGDEISRARAKLTEIGIKTALAVPYK
jgi:outer membrane biosynthesis protein TonB